MRAAVVVVAVLGACTPEIVAGSYYCGPNAACPEEQVCNEVDNRCVLPGLVQPFDCVSALNSEPDDTLETGYQLMNLDCVTIPLVIDACLPADDPADWLRFTAPASCTALEIDARITFPVAFQRVGLELVDAATADSVAVDTECVFHGEGGDDLRCLKAQLVPGSSYGLRIAPTGEGNCDGACAFNRYTVRAQLSPPD